jgi:hypothetical protein
MLAQFTNQTEILVSYFYTTESIYTMVILIPLLQVAYHHRHPTNIKYYPLHNMCNLALQIIANC